MEATMVVIGGVLALYFLAARRIRASMITGPMIFTAVGLLIGPKGFDLVDLSLSNDVVETLLTATLALILFVDATHIDLTALRRGWTAPVRLLGISFPIMLLAGFAAGAALFPGLDLFAVAVIATILAPTDAALGQAVITNPKVPLAIRQTLSVESGLNDGLALPVLITVLALAQAKSASDPWQILLDELIKEVGWGLVMGLGIGLITIASVKLADHWSASPTPTGVGVAGIGALVTAAGCALAVGGSVLIAAFVVGLVIAPTQKNFGHEVYMFPEELVEILSLIAFVVFGGAILSDELGTLDWRIGVYAVLSLALLRPVATAIGAVRSGAAPPTVAFVGWFGPRGLASILFVAIVVRKSPGLAGLETVNSVMVWTVLASIIAHGLSAWPGSNAYARWIARHPDQTIEGPEGRTPTDG